MVIAVDFDGVLCEERWPDIGPPREAVIACLLEKQRNGDKLILWTCREHEMLDRAVMWCLRQGLRFDAVNANLPERIEQYGNDCRKVGADEYWDDRSVIVRPGQGCEAEVLTSEMTILLNVTESVKREGVLERIINRLKRRKQE